MDIYDIRDSQILTYSRNVIKQINSVKGCNTLEEIQAIAFAGMVAYYGKERIDDIYLAFLKTNFVSCSEPIEKLLGKKYSLPSSVASKVSEHCQGTFYDVQGSEFVNKKTRKRRFEFDRTIYVQNDGSIDKEALVRGVCHQVNHVLNSIYNPIISTHGNLASRMGLSIDKLLSREKSYVQLEESINGLQTEDIMKEVYRLAKCQTDDELKKLVEEIAELGSRREVAADDDLTEIIRPLYEEDMFRTVLVDRRITGRLSGIRVEFDSKTRDGDYNDFLAACELVSAVKDAEHVEDGKNSAKKLVKKYIAGCEE